MVYNKDFEKILKDRRKTMIILLSMILLGWIVTTIFDLVYMLGLRGVSDLGLFIMYSVYGHSICMGSTIYLLKNLKNTKLYEVAKEIYIYEDRLEYITFMGLKMVVKYDWIGIIDADENEPYALILYYDEFLRRCNYMYLGKYLIPEILKHYKKWVERTGRKPCYIVVGKVSKKESQKAFVIRRKLEKSRFCKGAR